MQNAVFTVLAGQRRYLMRFALSRLGDRARAEDAVQETLLAALRATHQFGGRSSYRTWLTGILLHKIHDEFRHASRQMPRAASRDEGGEGDEGDADFFDENGAWLVPPGEWSEPERATEGKRFRAALTRGLSKLPARQAEAFVLREVVGMTSEEICRTLDVTRDNLWVMLHRARLRLRAELEAFVLAT